METILKQNKTKRKQQQKLRRDIKNTKTKRRLWIGCYLFGFLLEKCICAKLRFRQVEALDLVAETLKLLFCLATNDVETAMNSTKKMLEKSYPKAVCHLVKAFIDRHA
ncbi:DNA polymerase V family [Striga asiatica]|uniref:DNA polymerase V family n=1 Tax=Striga asiatica TaxID=4170 RepID=A0A5A7QA19_STRAF|nr:DNA polymerase V family [Striga asiatica]